MGRLFCRRVWLILFVPEALLREDYQYWRSRVTTDPRCCCTKRLVAGGISIRLQELEYLDIKLSADIRYKFYFMGQENRRQLVMRLPGWRPQTWRNKDQIKFGECRLPFVQNLLSCLLSKNIKIKIYGTIIVPVVLYGSETWSVTVRAGNRLRVYWNTIIRKASGPRQEK